MKRRGLRGRANRGGGSASPGGRLLERVRDLNLGLRDVRPLERPSGTPEGIELGCALNAERRGVAVVAARVAEADLLGWGYVAAQLARGQQGSAPSETVLVSAAYSQALLQAIPRARGQWRLIAAPGLAGDPEDLSVTLWSSGERRPDAGAHSLVLLDRVARTLEGAAVVTGVGGVRRIETGYALYVRGVRVLLLASEGDGVVVDQLDPERRQVHISESNFPRWGPELHEQVVRLAQDPRLLDHPAAHRDGRVLDAVAAAGAQLVGRWLPWNAEGTDPADWVGIDASGRAVIGFVRSPLGLAQAPALIAAAERLTLELEAWVPGGSTPVEIVVSSAPTTGDVQRVITAAGFLLRSVDGREGRDSREPREARELRDARDVRDTRDSREVREGRDSRDTRDSREPREARDSRGLREAREPREPRESRELREPREARDVREPRDARDPLEPQEAAAEGSESSSGAPERERGRGRRRSRRQRRGRGGGGLTALGEGRGEGSASGERMERRPDDSGEPDRLDADADGESPLDEESEFAAAGAGRDRGGREGAPGEDAARAAAFDGEPEADLDAELERDLDAREEDDEDEVEDEAAPLAVRAFDPTVREGEGEAEGEESGEGEDELFEPLDEAPIATAASPEAAAAPRAEPVRRRRPRAALAVRSDPESILAALVLARERRHIAFFWVCPQHQLMDFFRGKATDVDDRIDLLLVGFTAQPVPKETIGAAGLYRGQISWFDHHEWPVEDLELLRDAIGADSLFMTEGAANPMLSVMQTTERRSRFTDKVVDLSGRRLSEADMEKWGQRLMGLVQRMAAQPGDYRTEIQPVLAGKPSDLPGTGDVYATEAEWIGSHDPRVINFGEYQMVVSHVPEQLDAGEIGRRLRTKTGARLSLSTREGDSLAWIGCNDEKRAINILGMVEFLSSKLPWAHSRSSADRAGRLEIEELAQHPERIDEIIAEIVRHKSILYG